ncbi:MAG TPA: hypothetical protein VMC03_18575 [Streptosporangiaceae bacterium]|nr:hypothetical protein [Streptosporangiaceae bacterium]
MGLPFETPGGYQDDDTAPDTGRYGDDLTAPDFDGYSHDLSGGYQDPGEDDLGEDDLGEDDDFDYDYDERSQGDQAGWDPNELGRM